MSWTFIPKELTALQAKTAQRVMGTAPDDTALFLAACTAPQDTLRAYKTDKTALDDLVRLIEDAPALEVAPAEDFFGQRVAAYWKTSNPALIEALEAKIGATTA